MMTPRAFGSAGGPPGWARSGHSRPTSRIDLPEACCKAISQWRIQTGKPWSDPRFDETLLGEYTELTRRISWNPELLAEPTGDGCSHLSSSANRSAVFSAVRHRSRS